MSHAPAESHLRREADHFGDDRREVSVERCDNLTEEEASEVLRCDGAVELYACDDALPRE